VDATFEDQRMRVGNWRWEDGEEELAAPQLELEKMYGVGARVVKSLS
jgi:hypothetical protein